MRTAFKLLLAAMMVVSVLTTASVTVSAGECQSFDTDGVDTQCSGDDDDGGGGGGGGCNCIQSLAAVYDSGHPNVV